MISTMRRSAVLMLSILFLTACGPANDPAPVQSANLEGYPGPLTASSTPPAAAGMTTQGTFLPWKPDAIAVNYDTAVVPAGAVAAITLTGAHGAVRVRLAVSGMVPRRSYGAHLHTGSCTAVPEQAGPHYQHVPDPESRPNHPSADSRYANPANEVWLDFT